VELLFGWRGQRAGQLRPFGGRPPHARQRDQRLEQAVQVAWGGDPLPGSRGDAIQVRQAAQRGLQLAARQRILDEQGHAVEPLIERRPVPQWLVEPAPKLAGTHRRNCLAQHQADEVVSRWCALGSQPQALAGRRVEMHVGPGMLGMQAEEPGLQAQMGSLGVAQNTFPSLSTTLMYEVSRAPAAARRQVGVATRRMS